ncbi:SGNH/GDSL hydrolase family protein [Aliidiomarina minuta]|uniref:SGNH/GDSL hydrolase family protein n=1 Tax=Aliidiomarina minuta TaxID=880057 RepID=UPI0018E5270E|nr:SGNH/GDSL hydrolase family protein [Aliidiomarina minuta]
MHPVVTILLGPALLWQGRRVRKQTPRLPEAPGKREGVSGQGPSLRLLILGDSAAAGVGVARQSIALSGQLTQLLADTYTVAWKLHAKSGLTVHQVYQSLTELPKEAYDVVVVSAGVNDVTANTKNAQWLRAISQLIESLQQQYQVRLILFTAIPPMQAFPALPQPLRWYLGGRARLLNRLLLSATDQYKGVELLQVDFPLTRDYMAEDGFHPSARSCQLWAETAASRIEAFFNASDNYKY